MARVVALCLSQSWHSSRQLTWWCVSWSVTVERCANEQTWSGFSKVKLESEATVNDWNWNTNYHPKSSSYDRMIFSFSTHGYKKWNKKQGKQCLSVTSDVTYVSSEPLCIWYRSGKMSETVTSFSRTVLACLLRFPTIWLLHPLTCIIRSSINGH